ncbi:hypothetical protein Kisp01_33580 [Kineosporia sp. NBRC 101677]|uniref:50S ribosomal protein L11 methyltransferase n=1 Tax=Kineosporia sp. NBRC 101677 TaxID=3032197 RepID=UPI0024A1F24D|nr:50S ribosomal protein L11 methyltransferase [Kineosporia sp. NBRC 101677]GLY16343.1 hypothetical protein Kisp01_33580 [Kineosporia sp. NBRC 101677]
MTRAFVAEVEAAGRRLPVRACAYEDDPPVWLFPSIGEYPLYDNFAYGQMLNDELRMQQYAAAVAKHAPGRTVLDIGTGQDAVWALAAARAGAQHVWAMEVIPKSAQIARQVIEEAGYSDRVTVVEGLSTEISLPERVDLCVSEIIGTLGGSEGAGSVLRDARERLVKPDGLFIPHVSVTTVVGLDLGAVTAEPPAFPLFVLDYVGQVFNCLSRPFDLRLCLVGLQDNPARQDLAYLSGAAEVETLHFNGDLQPESTDAAQIHFGKAGRLHGLALGMRLWVDPDGTGDPLDSLIQPSSWTPVYAPLSQAGLPVREGDRFEFTWSTELSDDGVHPDYALTGTLHRRLGPPVPLRWSSGHHSSQFRKTPFYQALFPVE